MIKHRITADEFNKLLRTSEYGGKYLQVIAAGYNRPRPKSLRGRSTKGYERHHIIPRAFGGTDENNLVLLTTYEHIVAHYYLVLLTDNVHMFTAFNYMLGKQFTRITEIERIKLEELEHWAHVRNEARTRLFSDEGRATISQKAKERWQRFKKSGRIDEVRANISKTTSEGMANSKKSQIRTRVNLGCKKYWNPETGEARNWYPGMPPFESPWIPGRPKMTESAKQKLKETLAHCKKHFYHNDELKINTTFNENDTVPAGWIRGKKVEYDATTKIYKRTIKEQRLQELLNS